MSISQITPTQFRTLLSDRSDTIEIIDVREPSEFSDVRIRGSKNVPLSTISEESPIDWNKTVIFVCRSWARSQRVASSFDAIGKSSTNLLGGVGGIWENYPECLE